MQVAELYRAGFSASLIASKLGVAVTEVELTIALAEQGSLTEESGGEPPPG
jgi:hypothetical protein